MIAQLARAHRADSFDDARKIAAMPFGQAVGDVEAPPAAHLKQSEVFSFAEDSPKLCDLRPEVGQESAPWWPRPKALSVRKVPAIAGATPCPQSRAEALAPVDKAAILPPAPPQFVSN